MLLKITVTQQHIDRANILRRNPLSTRISSCPVALAIQGAGFPKAWVGLSSVRLEDENDRKGTLPDFVQYFIDRYDAKESVSPIEFELEVPDAN